MEACGPRSHDRAQLESRVWTPIRAHLRIPAASSGMDLPSDDDGDMLGLDDELAWAVGEPLPGPAKPASGVAGPASGGPEGGGCGDVAAPSARLKDVSPNGGAERGVGGETRGAGRPEATGPIGGPASAPSAAAREPLPNPAPAPTWSATAPGSVRKSPSAAASRAGRLTRGVEARARPHATAVPRFGGKPAHTRRSQRQSAAAAAPVGTAGLRCDVDAWYRERLLSLFGPAAEGRFSRVGVSPRSEGAGADHAPPLRQQQTPRGATGRGTSSARGGDSEGGGLDQSHSRDPGRSREQRSSPGRRSRRRSTPKEARSRSKERMRDRDSGRDRARSKDRHRSRSRSRERSRDRGEGRARDRGEARSRSQERSRDRGEGRSKASRSHDSVTAPGRDRGLGSVTSGPVGDPKLATASTPVEVDWNAVFAECGGWERELERGKLEARQGKKLGDPVRSRLPAPGGASRLLPTA